MKNRLSRRDFIRLSVVVSGAGLVATQCAPNVTEVTKEITKEVPVEVTRVVQPTATPEPKAGLVRGGRLVHTSPYTWPTQDVQLSSYPGIPTYPLMYNYLLNHRLVDAASGRFEIVGELAESYEYSDPQTFVLHLRKGIKFHDGSDFDSEVAKWNIDRLRGHELARDRDQLKMIDSVTAPDKWTVVVRLKEASGTLPIFLSGGYVGWPGMVSMKAVEKLGDEAFGQAPVGTGPFRFKELITDDRLIVERFDDYWENGQDGGPLPYLDEIVVRFMPDLTVATAELAAKSIDSAQEMPPSQWPAIKAIQHLAWDNWPWVGFVLPTGFINTERPPWNDVRVRKALNYSIDRTGMAKAVGFDMGVPASIPFGVGSGVLGWSEEAERMYDYDPDRAKALLKEAGYPDGFDTTMDHVFREPDNTVAQFLAAKWREVGIRVSTLAAERLFWSEKVQVERDYDLAFARWTNSLIDPAVLYMMMGCGLHFNCGGICDPVIEDLMAKGSRETDQSKRHEIYRQLFLQVQENAYWFCGVRIPVNIVRNKLVQGVSAMHGIVNLRSVWISQL